MDFAWTSEQLHWKETIVQFAQTTLNDGLSAREQQQAFHWGGWRQCGKAGLLGLSLPRRYGGQGLEPLTTRAALEALGYGCQDNGLNFAVNAHLWGCAMPIGNFGDERQKAIYLPGLCSGEWVGALAASERQAGSDVYSLQTTATRDGDHYLLNGGKMFVTNAPIANRSWCWPRLIPAKDRLD